MGQTEALLYKLIEEAMAKKPTKALRGIPIGGSFEAIADQMGSMKVKPKRKKPGQTLNQVYKSANRKKYRAAK